MSETAPWAEIYDGGSPEAEQAIFRALAEDMARVQEANRQKSGAAVPGRTLHAKLVVGVTNAVFTVAETLPPDFAVSHIQPGATLSAAIRFSNASGVPQHDATPDMRGAAVKLSLPDGGIHDLLMTSFPVSHARDARQFVEFAVIASGDRETMQARLLDTFGAAETQRILGNLRQGIRPCASLALERFWSRGAILWGQQPVRFQLIPVSDPTPASAATDDQAPDALRADFARRLAQKPIAYRFALQRFVSEHLTPIEDGATEWREEDSPPIDVATLTIPRQDILAEPGVAQAAAVDALAFNPWNAPDAFRPLGNLNRVRGMVYGKSAERWQAQR